LCCFGSKQENHSRQHFGVLICIQNIARIKNPDTIYLLAVSGFFVTINIMLFSLIYITIPPSPDSFPSMTTTLYIFPTTALVYRKGHHGTSPVLSFEILCLLYHGKKFLLAVPGSFPAILFLDCQLLKYNIVDFLNLRKT